jgi:hypothetical protein
MRATLWVMRAVDGHDNESEGEVTRARVRQTMSRRLQPRQAGGEQGVHGHPGRNNRASRWGDTAGHSQVRKVLELAAERQQQSRATPSWSARPTGCWNGKLQPSDSVLNKMQVEFLQKIQAGRKAGMTRRAGRATTCSTTPRRNSTAEAQSLSTRGMAR